MTTEQTAQQLELAAQILRTGHPFEVRHDASDRWHASLGVNPAQAVLQDWHIRPVLATPPDNRPLHNPDNLTAEAVGVGYRLFLTSEEPNTHVKLQEKWKVDEWVPSGAIYADHLTPESNTYRLPLSVPWPEPADPYAELKAAHAAGKVIQWFNGTTWIDLIKPVDPSPLWLHPAKDLRIKPEPAFQLPPPPPGMRWHREDGWKADDLPSGYRPLVLEERFTKGDEVRNSSNEVWEACENLLIGDEPYIPCKAVTRRSRTARPLTFAHAGKTWTWHRPGDPMPCDGGRRVQVVMMDGHVSPDCNGEDWDWSAKYTTSVHIIGWRYADEKKTVPLGPEDILPGSVIQGVSSYAWHWIAVVSVHQIHIKLAGCCGDIGTDTPTWEQLKLAGRINRSIPLTGKWNPDAWEPCSKEIPA